MEIEQRWGKEVLVLCRQSRNLELRGNAAALWHAADHWGGALSFALCSGLRFFQLGLFSRSHFVKR